MVMTVSFIKAPSFIFVEMMVRLKDNTTSPLSPKTAINTKKTRKRKFPGHQSKYYAAASLFFILFTISIIAIRITIHKMFLENSGSADMFTSMPIPSARTP